VGPTGAPTWPVVPCSPTYSTPSRTRPVAGYQWPTWQTSTVTPMATAFAQPALVARRSGTLCRSLMILRNRPCASASLPHNELMETTRDLLNAEDVIDVIVIDESESGRTKQLVRKGYRRTKWEGRRQTFVLKWKGRSPCPTWQTSTVTLLVTASALLAQGAPPSGTLSGERLVVGQRWPTRLGCDLADTLAP